MPIMGSKVRPKLSTTVAPETFEFLERQVKSGEASNIAEAIDLIVERFRRAENRRRLSLATTAYFAGPDSDSRALQEENAIAYSLASGASNVDFDHEL